MRRLLKACLLAISGVIVCGAAQAATLTFDIPSPGGPGLLFQVFQTYSEAGFEISTDASALIPDALLSWTNGNFPLSADPSHTSATLLGNRRGHAVEMQALNGLPFSFSSIDLADTFNQNPPTFGDPIQFTFNHHDGTSSTATVTLDGAAGLQTFTFTETNLDSVTWIDTNLGQFEPQVDNVVAVASVAPTPIPATLPLLVSALGGLGFLGFRRQRVFPI